MTRYEHSVLPLLAISLVALSAARLPDPPQGIWRPVFLPPTLVNLPSSQPVAGNFTGHGHPDIAFLAGGKVGLLSAPCVHNAADQIASSLFANDVLANGIAPTKSGATSGRDGLAIATANGLRQWWLGRPISWITPITEPDAWHSVAVGDLDGEGAEDFVGIGDGNTVRVRLRGNVSQTLVLSFPATETIAAVVAAQWDGLGPQEICVATTAGLWIGTPTQQTLAERLQPNTGNGHLVRVAMPNYDSLAWLTTVDEVPRLLTTSKDVPGLFCDPAIQLGAVHAASGRWNDDAYGDLVVTEVDSNVVHLFTNGAGGTSTPGLAQFTNQNEAISPEGPQLSGATLSCTWLGDLNADGVADLVTIQNNDRAWVFTQDSASSNRPTLLAQSVSSFIDSSTVAYTMSLGPGSGPPAGATHLELLLFAVTGTESAVLVPAGLSRTRYDVVNGIGPGSFSFEQDFATINTEARAGLVRWIRVVGGITVELFQPTLFTVASGATMQGSLEAWKTMRQEQAPNTGHTHPGGGSNYVWGPINNGPISTGLPGGVEEPPDLPPKPPEPPTPPAPPPPPIN